MSKLIQLKHKDISILRKQWWLDNNKTCPIANKKVPLSECTLDHQHKLKSEVADESGKGLCRGVLWNRSNAWEGKVWNSFKRLGLNSHIDIVSALRNLADYLESNHIHDDIKYIHPSEAPPKLKLKKSSYNKLKSVMSKNIDNRKLPKYTGNLTQPLKKLFNEYNINPEFYGN